MLRVLAVGTERLNLARFEVVHSSSRLAAASSGCRVFATVAAAMVTSLGGKLLHAVPKHESIVCRTAFASQIDTHERSQERAVC